MSGPRAATVRGLQAAAAAPSGGRAFGRSAARSAPTPAPLLRRSAAAALSRRELLSSGAAAAALLPPMAAHGAPAGAAAAAAAAGAAAAPAAADIELRELRTELDANGVERLALQTEGWNRWTWRGHRVNWLSAGERGPIVLLIHGFGASVYHWRYNVPELSRTCRVYALDCLGFGWSDKPLEEYGSYRLWSDQIADFIREVIGDQAGGGERVVLVGNSLGGYNALACAAQQPDLVRGVVLLNAAGRFEDPAAEGQQAPADAEPSLWSSLVSQVSSAVQRLVVAASFIFTKQPARIKQVLSQVYVSDRNIDDDLVRSIALPAQDPNAAEVFYRIITGRGEPMNRLLARLDGLPLYLLWGDKDPWCVPARATQIQQYYPAAQRTDIDSGHCPHDDTPEEVNARLRAWLEQLPPQAA